MFAILIHGISNLCIGDRVKFAHEDTLPECERGDRGRVLGFDASHTEALIVWDSGVRTWTAVTSLDDEES